MIDNEIKKNFGRIWPQHVASLVQFLIECRKSFDGDIDLFLVLCIIGDRTFSARHVPPDLDFESWNESDALDLRTEEINIQSLADYSGIPRETVRRKISTLIEKGWVTRDERGFITATQRAKEDLAPLTNSSLVYLSRMKTTLTDR